MSLFDAYDPATYQPSQSGLIDRLLASASAMQRAANAESNVTHVDFVSRRRIDELA